MKLNALRVKIDEIDNLLLSLLAKRLTIVQQIGRLKKGQKLPVEDKEREKLIIERIKKAIKEYGLEDDYILPVFMTILKLSKKMQRKL